MNPDHNTSADPMEPPKGQAIRPGIRLPQWDQHLKPGLDTIEPSAFANWSNCLSELLLPAPRITRAVTISDPGGHRSAGSATEN
jgi:hypothetical protein